MALKFSETLAEALNRASVFLEEYGHDGNLARQYWLMTFDWSFTKLINHLRQPVDKDLLIRYEAVLERIIQDEPIQYILGYADFMDQRFKISTDTLIPREDTAGLVVLAEKYLTQYPTASVLDIGTGSGIIAITIAKKFPKASIYAVDISKKALDIAKLNNQIHQTNVQFCLSDILRGIPLEKVFDLIISNPPYISHQEVNLMDRSVLKYEPHTALFADNDGLEIYQRIAEESIDRITHNGMILLEIGFRQGESVQQIFRQQYPKASIMITQDLNKHNRYVSISMKGESR